MVGNTEASQAAYAASRISSNLKGSTKQFGWLQACATKKSFLSATPANPATIPNLDVAIWIRGLPIESPA
jgi:hypothetical protein